MSFVQHERKPCTYSGCHGTMRFSNYARRVGLEVRVVGDTGSSVPSVAEAPGWVCDTDQRHFERTSVDAAWRV